MSQLEELIRQFCPEGIKYDKIKNVFSRLKGTAITASKMKEIACPDGEIRIFAGGKTIIDTHEKDIPKANITRVPAVLVQSRGIIDVIYYDKPFTFKNEMWAYSSSNPVTTEFLYYVLKNNIEKFREAASGMGSLPQISLSVTDNFLVPIPPLEIQQEIVRILDQFTQLTAELTAELTARKLQYQEYLTRLLDFNNGIDWHTLDDLFNIRNGYTPSKKVPENWKGGDIPWFRMEDIRLQGRILSDAAQHVTKGAVKKSGLFQKNSVILSTTATLGEYALIETDFLCNQQLTCFTIKGTFSEQLLPKFAFYYFNIIGSRCYNIANYSGGIPIVDQKKLKKLSFPVPPLPEQRRIVALLDRFDALCNDLTSGLPAEIAARQKQYEYYRDKLLTFKKLEE